MSDEQLADGVLEDTITRLFNERCGPQVRQLAESEGWAPELSSALVAGGIASIGVPETAGGPGGSISDVAVVLRLAGRHAVPLPVAESSGLLGGWLVATAGLSLPPGFLTVAVPRRGDGLRIVGDRVTGCLQRVPWGSRVATIVATAWSREGEKVVLLDPRNGAISPGRNLAGEPRDRLDFEDVVLPLEHVGTPPHAVSRELRLRGALSRTLLMAGAMEAVTDLTVGYAKERHQFGRPIATFQAVAQRLALMGSETELAALAAQVAAQRFAVSGVGAAFEVSAAKATAARAATEVAAHAHQVHGAIGMSQEYTLHHFTRRLWTWRQEWGSEDRWAQELGEQVAEAGAPALWPRVATTLQEL